MEALLFIPIIIILILLVSLKNDLTRKLDTLFNRVNSLSEELKKSRSREEQIEHKKTIIEEIVIQHKAPVITPVPEVAKQEEKKIPETKQEVITQLQQEVKPTSSPLSAPARVENKPPTPGFFERNPDLEKFIGENLANKIGIGVLVLGIGFFVKYAIDQNWINEIGRVFIGILCGGILLGVAHRLRKTFTAFSSVLVGGGIAVLYLTIGIAFHEYQLFNQTAAFVLMLVITGFSVLLSLGYNRIELAILSILGGFASPFMVSTGEGDYVVLFTYILILDVGMLVLAYYKKWNLVNIVSYIFTVLLFGSWLFASFDESNIGMIRGAMIYATLFYLVFFAMNIINNIKERTPFKAIEFSLLLSNTFLFYSAGMFILSNNSGEELKGLFTASIGVFNFIFAYALYKNNRLDKNLIFLLIGLVLTFISLAAPVQLHGNYITLFWSAETVLLLWLSQKSGIRLMKLASVVVMALMVISLVMDWKQLYLQNMISTFPILLNKAYTTSLFSLFSFGATLYLLRIETSENTEQIKLYKDLLLFIAVVVLYVSQFLELQHQLFQYEIDYEVSTIIIGCYNMLFVLALLLAEKKLMLKENLKKAFAFWGVAAMIAYLVFYHHHIIDSRNDFLLHGASATGFIFHYILVLLLLIVVGVSLPKIRKMIDFHKKTYDLYSWFYVFFFVFIASAELDHLVLVLSHVTYDSIHYILTQNHKIGYPILWGLSSFVLIAVGMKMKKRSLRIISLTLFLITLLKLFLVDIKGISEGGKIAAFISLGVLLLIVSFMYQRLKKLLIADEPQTEKIEKGNQV